MAVARHGPPGFSNCECGGVGSWIGLLPSAVALTVLIVTIAESGLMQLIIDVEADRSGDLLASERARAMGAFRRTYQAWPDSITQEVDGQPAYPRRPQ